MKIEGFAKMLEQIQRERGIPKEALVSAIEAALVSACKRRFTTIENLEASIDESGVARIFAKKEVVAKVVDEAIQISLKAAKKVNPKAKKGSTVKVEVTPADFGRFAVQTAKQVIIQRIREAEKEGAFEEYSKHVGDMITGTVQRRERGGYLINLGKVETLLPVSELVPNEIYRPRDRIKVYIVDVKKTPKGPFVSISRTHPGLVKKLFEMEIPEIPEGILEIKEVAREAGRRSKVAVFSHDKNVGAVGTCVGHMGSRIQSIVKELGSERVDIVEWDESPAKFIANSLSPAKISKVEILNKEEKSTRVFVPEDQLSLAIGKEGQNVRLAAKLTGWKIDIVSKEKEEEAPKEKAKAAKEKAKKKEEEKPAPPKAGKTRVHELAKELGKTSKELIEVLKGLGVEAKGPTSNITLEDKKRILEKLKGV